MFKPALQHLPSVTRQVARGKMWFCCWQCWRQVLGCLSGMGLANTTHVFNCWTPFWFHRLTKGKKYGLYALPLFLSSSVFSLANVGHVLWFYHISSSSFIPPQPSPDLCLGKLCLPATRRLLGTYHFIIFLVPYISDLPQFKTRSNQPAKKTNESDTTDFGCLNLTDLLGCNPWIWNGQKCHVPRMNSLFRSNHQCPMFDA